MANNYTDEAYVGKRVRKPIYKRWWFWVIVVIILMKLYSSSSEERSKPSGNNGADVSMEETITNETQQSADDKADIASFKTTYSNVETYVDSIGTAWVQAIVEVENTGTTNLFLSPSKFDFEDENGLLVASDSMVASYPQIIAPGEKGYYYDESLLDDSNRNTKLTLIPKLSIKAAYLDLVRLDVSELSIKTNSINTIEVTGRLENNTGDVVKGPYVAIILYDYYNKPIGVVFTILVEEIDVGEKTGFEASAFSLPNTVTESSVARMAAFAYPFQYQF